MINLLASANPLSHVLDHPYEFGVVEIGGMKLHFATNHIFMMIAAAILLILVIPVSVKPKNTGDDIEDMTPKRSFLGHGIEFICVFLRDFVGKPNLGPHTDRFMKYLWTAFFFILFCNLLGLLPLEPITKLAFGNPIYGTATANIFVTSTLAIITLMMIVVNGLRLHGMDYVSHFFMGPFPISILIAFLEIIGLLVKAVALAIRLAANMTAGHILLAVLMSFIGMAGSQGMGIGVAVTIPTILGSVAINMLELFVAFLQAFIFTFLSGVFIGQAVNIHHDDDHAHHHEHHQEEAPQEYLHDPGRDPMTAHA